MQVKTKNILFHLVSKDIRQELFHFAQEEGLALTHLAQAPKILIMHFAH